MQHFERGCYGLSLTPFLEFDAVAYAKGANLGVVLNSRNVWQHYCDKGWQKQLRPNHWFDPKWYAKKYNIGADQNPFFHFCYLGCRYGASPNPDAYSETQERITAVFKGFQRTFVYDKGARYAFNLSDYKKKYLALVDFALLPEEHFVNVGGIERFRSITSRKVAGIGLNTFLSSEVSGSFSFLDEAQSLYFNPDFYADYYSIPSSEAWDDFKSAGYGFSRYPNLATAGFEYLIIRRYSPHRKSKFYTKSDLKQVLKHEIVKQSDEITGSSGEIERAYKSLFNDYFSHRAFIHRKRIMGIYETADQLNDAVLQLKDLGILDEAYYRSFFKGEKLENPHEHYLLYGQNLGIPPNTQFDFRFYIETYPDLIDNVREPALHFENFGRDEGRLSLGLGDIEVLDGQIKYVKSKKTVILVTHESSRTGAPVVAVNLAKFLSNTCNVVIWTGKSGILDDAFREVSVRYLVGWSDVDTFREALKSLKDEFNADTALVNSIVCYPTIPRFLANKMSVLSLFHEFAFYVLPHGHSSRALILSDHAIFPAAIVRDSFRQELREFHPASDIPQGISTIRPQGFNKSGPKHDVMSRDAFNKMFGVDSDKVKVVLGAGQINTRKGLDLFVQTARKVIDQSDAYDWRFIWVGGKFDVKKDPEHALYLDYFLRVHTIGDFVFFVPHQDSMDIFFTCADVFFLSSRLDPYPNVVLDAIESETPALVFRDATGFGPIIQDYEGVIYAVGYGDVEEAARALVNIIENPKSLAKQKREELTRLLSFETYVDDVRACLKTSQSSAKKRERLCETLEKKSYRELLDMAGALPNYLFREYAVYDKEEYIIRLSSFLSKLDTTKTKFGDLPDSSHVCNASFEDRDLSSSHTILCFSDRAELIQDFLELYGVLGMKFIVGENYKDLKGDKAENISVLSGPSSDFASFLSNDSLDVNGKNVAILNLSAFSLDLCSSVNNLMLGLISGRCENFMAEYPECDGIMPADNRFYDAGFMTPDATAQCGYFKLAELRHALELALNRQKTPRFDVYEFMKNFISNHFIAANLNPWLH